MAEEHDGDVTGRGLEWDEGAGRVTRTVGVGSLIDGRFELVSLQGEGGMGRVFKAIDHLAQQQEAPDPHVAIKILRPSFQQDPTAVKALHREFFRARALSHVNILRIDQFEQDRESGLYFIVMELLQGTSLESVIAENRVRRRGQSWSEIAGALEQICAGLQCAHEEGIIHSDIKPSNLFITTRGRVKILDFGIAALRPGLSGDGRVTRYDPRQLGALSPDYASLEMFLGREADDSDDVYGLACVTYEWLTGRHPYERPARPGAVVPAPEALYAPDPAPVPALTRSQNAALRKALAVRREDRTQTIRELWESLSRDPPTATRLTTQVAVAAAGLPRSGGWLPEIEWRAEALSSVVLLAFVALLVMLIVGS